jgi:hypothetical protein
MHFVPVSQLDPLFYKHCPEDRLGTAKLWPDDRSKPAIIPVTTTSSFRIDVPKRYAGFARPNHDYLQIFLLWV